MSSRSSPMTFCVTSRPRWLLVAGVIAVIANCSSAWSQEVARYTGLNLYKAYCASCHGTGGAGDGPVASSLNVEVPDLRRIAIRHSGQFPTEQVRKIIDGRTTIPPHGPRAMPVWGREFREDPSKQKRASNLVDLLVDYIRSIQQE